MRSSVWLVAVAVEPRETGDPRVPATVVGGRVVCAAPELAEAEGWKTALAPR